MDFLNIYILNTFFTIPAKAFGSLNTTTFIKIFLLYHLKRHIYASSNKSTVSINATAAIGKNNPAAVPMQNENASIPSTLQVNAERHIPAKRLQPFIIPTPLLVYNM